MTDGQDSKTCEQCGQTFHRAKGRGRAEFAARRFCSQECGYAGLRRGTRAERCRSGRHEKGGASRCAECHRERNRGRRRAPVVAPRPRRRKPVPVPVVRPESAPTWRPAGWSATPRTRR